MSRWAPCKRADFVRRLGTRHQFMADKSGIPARSSPCDTACSAGPGFYPALPGSSPITTPFLLSKLTRSKGPSLHRHYPASSVPLTLSDTQTMRNPFRSRRRSRPCHHPGPPLLTADYLLGMLCSLPRWSNPCRWLSVERAPAPGSSGLARPSPLQSRVGTTLRLSRPARASHALRPAKLLAHLSVDFVARFRPGRFPDRTAR